MKLAKLFLMLEELERPVFLSRTKTSRLSDEEISKFSALLAPFIAIFMARGYFNPQERQELEQLFKQYAQKQYFLGQAYADKARDKETPLTVKDITTIDQLARDAEREFTSTLTKQRQVPHAPAIIAGLAAAYLGIKALNRGTTSHAKQVVFTTRRDDRVCPICEKFDGMVYDVSESTGIVKNGPLIPDSTHPNCRCRYLVLG